MAQTFHGLTVEQIIGINRQMIESSGDDVFIEPDNLRLSGMIAQISEEVQATYFGEDRFPTAIEKAAVLAWRIIAGHLFHNGNKRTGIMVCYQTLEFNRFELLATDDDVVAVATAIALGNTHPDHLSQADFIMWVQNHTRARKSKRRSSRSRGAKR